MSLPPFLSCPQLLHVSPPPQICSLSNCCCNQYIKTEIYKHNSLNPFAVACVHLISGLPTLYQITNSETRLWERILPLLATIIFLKFFVRKQGPEVSLTTLGTIVQVLFRWSYCSVMDLASILFPVDTISQQNSWSPGSYSLSTVYPDHL